MIQDFRASIMAPIGEPINITGFNPIFKRPEPFVRPIPPIQPPQLPPVTPPPILPPVITPPVARPVIPPQPPSIGGIGGINQDPRPLERPIIPPRRDDFMSIERLPSPVASPVEINNNFATTPIVPGSAGPISVDTVGRTGGTDDFIDTYYPDRIKPVPLQIDPSGRELSRELPPGFTPPNVAPPTSGIKPPIQNIADPAPTIPGMFAPGGPGMSIDEMSGVGLNTGFRTSLGGTPPPPDTGMPNPNLRVTYNEGVIDPAPTTPAAVATDVGAVPDTTMPIGAIDPVLLQQATAETLTDPLIRSLYFGTADSPGFFQQLQQAGANLIGSDVPLQQTAGLTPLEVLARQQAVAGIGGFEPFLQQNRELVNQAIAQSRRAEQLQDPYYTQAEQIYQDTMGAYDPSMTQQFFNPFEDAVVQQTISDVLEAGEQQDIAARAREIGAGAFGGSRARLGAMERREALGEGLAQALGRIRQQGFSEAQRTGLGEFARQQQAKRTGAQGLIGIGTGRGSAAGNLAQRLAGFGGQMTDLGRTQEQLRSGQRRELAGFGTTGRGIEETGLSRLFEQQLGQQLRPIQTLGQIGAMLPGYQQTRTQIDSQYGMPTDPTAAGLGAAFSAYGALAPRQGSS